MRDVDKKKGSLLLEEMVNAQSSSEEEKGEKRKMKEREKQRNLDPARGSRKRNPDSGRLESDCERDEWKMEDEQSETPGRWLKGLRTYWTRRI